MDEGKVLESWKEIADYLRRNVRTCRRWELEMGLPVHRLDGSSKARVFAYSGELDHWLEEKIHGREEPPRRPKIAKPLRAVAVASVAVPLVALAAYLVWRYIVPRELPTLSPSVPSLAVLRFENLSGDKSLDVWRDALPTVLIADLSQSRDIRVVSGEQLLTAMRRLSLADVPRFSSNDIGKIAAQTKATYALTGSLVKAGESIVITAVLQKPGLGMISKAYRAEARDENGIISSMDELTRNIMAGLNLSAAELGGGIKNTAGTITTASAEALKYYVQGRMLQFSNEWARAIPYLEKAVEIDPDFAMAYRNLAMAHRDLWHIAESRKCMNKALALSARLPDNERLVIEGQASYWDEDYAKARGIFEGLLRSYPGHPEGHRYLGRILYELEDLDGAIEHQEFVVQNGGGIVDVRALAVSYQKKGLYRKAEALCRSFLGNDDNSWWVRQMLVYCLLFLSHPDAALAEAQRDYLESPRVKADVGIIMLFRGDLEGAEKYLGPPRLFLVRGQFRENAEFCRRNLEQAKGSKGIEAIACRGLADALEKAGRLDEAYQAFRRSLEDSGEYRRSVGEAALPYLPRTEKEDLLARGRLQAKMGAFEEAGRTADELESLVRRGLNKKDMRYCDYIRGLIELGKKKPLRAVVFFERACAGLDFETIWSTEHAGYYDGLARALYDTGDLGRARETYEKITLLTTGRLSDGDIYAKAFYMLGKIAEQQGKTGKARESYERFLGLWKDADAGIPEVEDARRRLAGLQKSGSS